MNELIDGLTEGVEGEAGGGGQIGEGSFEMLPETFDGVEFRAIGWQVDQDDIGGWRHGAGDMGGGVVEYQEVEGVGLLLAEVIQEQLKTGGVQSGQIQPERLTRDGLDGGVKPAVLVTRSHHFQGFDAMGGDPASHREVETEAGFILPPQAHRRGRFHRSQDR